MEENKKYGALVPVPAAVQEKQVSVGSIGRPPRYVINIGLYLIVATLLTGVGFIVCINSEYETLTLICLPQSQFL